MEKNHIIVTGEIITLMPVRYLKSGRQCRQAIMRMDQHHSLVAFTLWQDHTYSIEEGQRIKAQLGTEVKVAYNDPERYLCFLNLERILQLEEESHGSK